MPLAAGTRLGPYEILAPLGAGGMGEVYRARDTKLDRDVAIKVLPESVAGSPQALARFEREAKAVATLSHPNILAIFDFGRHDGTAYAVMELLEGATLREKLNAGSIPQKQAIEYGVQIARGLSAAHERGIVHRDLKPENLFVTRDGHLKILDFGLAKRLETHPGPEETNTPTETDPTTPGTVLGTVGYMSPEQVRGLPVDHRSDIFSFGAILFELLSGQRAFKRATAADTMSAILKEEPPALVPGEVPAALEGVVRHCLEKEPENRFQSARDVAFALTESSRGPTATGVRPVPPSTGRRSLVIAAAAIAILAAVGVVFLRWPRPPPGEGPRVKRVAVLPFENLGAPEDDYFADGIADEVRGKLTSVPGIEVIARASSVDYKKTKKTPKDIADELDAPYLLTATVRWQKNGRTSRVQVRPELVEVKGSGAPTSRWQQPFDASLTDVFKVQSDIATRVAEALGVVLEPGDEKRLGHRPTQNLAAYDAFLRGEEIWTTWSGGPLTPRRALDFFERAVSLDPSFAEAWARVCRASSELYYTTISPDDAARARRAGERAIALAPDLPEVHLAWAHYQYNVLYDPRAFFREVSKAALLAPGSAEVLTRLGEAEGLLGRHDESLRRLRQAERLDPRSEHIKLLLSEVLLWLRRHDAALEAVNAALRQSPADVRLVIAKTEVFVARGDLGGARGVIRDALKLTDSTALVAQLAFLGLGWVLEAEQADLLLRLAPSAFSERKDWAICLAEAHALRNEDADARRYAQEVQIALDEKLRRNPRDAAGLAVRALALAYVGRHEDAIREARLAMDLTKAAGDQFLARIYQHQLARIYMVAGQPDHALDHLEPLLEQPFYLTPAWLKIDPNFDSLRKHLRFQKLVAGA